MTLDTKISLRVQSTLANTLDLAQAAVPLDWRSVIELGTGTGTGQADRQFSDRRTLAASGTENLDLAGGLTDGLGATITMARLKGIVVKASALNTHNVLVGGAGANGLLGLFGDVTDVLVVRPGAEIMVIVPDATAIAVTAATGDILKVANSGAVSSVEYEIILIGASA